MLMTVAIEFASDGDGCLGFLDTSFGPCLFDLPSCPFWPYEERSAFPSGPSASQAGARGLHRLKPDEAEERPNEHLSPAKLSA